MLTNCDNIISFFLTEPTSLLSKIEILLHLCSSLFCSLPVLGGPPLCFGGLLFLLPKLTLASLLPCCFLASVLKSFDLPTLARPTIAMIGNFFAIILILTDMVTY